MTNTVDDQGGLQVRHMSTLVRWMRAAYVLVAVCFVCAIALQVFFAGAGVLVHPRYIGVHTTFGHSMQFFPLGLILLSLAGRLPWRLLGLTALTFVLFVLQYIFLWVIPAFGIPVLRALHAVNALALFWISLVSDAAGVALKCWTTARRTFTTVIDDVTWRKVGVLALDKKAGEQLGFSRRHAPQ